MGSKGCLFASRSGPEVWMRILSSWELNYAPAILPFPGSCKSLMEGEIPSCDLVGLGQ